MVKENYIVLQDDDGDWLTTNEIANRIREGEDFDFNARLDSDLTDDSHYLRLNSKDPKLKLRHIKKEK